MGNLKFYRDEPLFGLDIGYSSIKAVQAKVGHDGNAIITGYGVSAFDPTAFQNGVVAKPKVITDAIHSLFEKNLVGKIDSRRVACALPTARTFNRPMKLPAMEHNAIVDAIHLEAEQYIPVPINNLYIDYEISYQDAQTIELVLVAASKNIVDSYHNVLEALQLEPVAFEPSINSASRLVQKFQGSTPEPVVIVDMGSVTTDIAVFDKAVLVASTVNTGGEHITKMIVDVLRLSHEQAVDLKIQYGIAYSEKQQRIVDAIKPVLASLTHEIEKSIRYYSERAATSGRQISKILTLGGASMMPGLNQYISKELRLPTQSLEPWEKINFGQLAKPSGLDLAIYTIAAGEALVTPTEILQ